MAASKPKSPKGMQSKPGMLRSDVTMEIQTGLAQRFVQGRERSAETAQIIGVNGFGHRTRVLWQAAEADDPYADWFLLQIEDSINIAKQMIDAHSKRIGEVLAAMDGFTIKIAHSVKPIQVELRFSNPYGYMGAYLVNDFDVMSRTVLTARHLGLIDRIRSDEILRSTGRVIRRTFNYSVLWRFTGVNREDIRQMNQNAERAKALMGDLPSDVLEGKKRARMAPPINRKPNPNPAATGSATEPEATKNTPTSDGVEDAIVPGPKVDESPLTDDLQI